MLEDLRRAGTERSFGTVRRRRTRTFSVYTRFPSSSREYIRCMVVSAADDAESSLLVMSCVVKSGFKNLLPGKSYSLTLNRNTTVRRENT